jgi:hypothetical protein
MFVFTFKNLEELNRVLDYSPWNIKGSPLFLKRWFEEDAIEDLDFAKAAYWVQVHNLPLELMTDDNARNIGGSLGELLEVDSDAHKPARKGFLRFRVLLNLLNPLNPGFTHHRPPKTPLWIQYSYERLSDYCYTCGRIGHVSYACKVEPRPPDHGRYGEMLKAKSPRISRVVQLIQPRAQSSNELALISPPNSPHTGSQTLATSNLQYRSNSVQLSPSLSTQPSSSNNSLWLPRNHPITSSPVVSAPAVAEKSSFVNNSLNPINSSLLFANIEKLNDLTLHLPKITWPFKFNSPSNSGPLTPPLTAPNSLLGFEVLSSQETSFPTITSLTSTCTQISCLPPNSTRPYPLTPTAENLTSSHSRNHRSTNPSTSRKRFHPYPKSHPSKKPRTNDGAPSVSSEDILTQDDSVPKESEECKTAGVEGFNLPPPAQ